MALNYILQQVGFKMGLNPAIAGQRAVMLRFVNEAASELYSISDMAGCLEEAVFMVNPDQTLSLPDYVGHSRAMRKSDNQQAIGLTQMRPRYNEFNYMNGWRNWRIKGSRPLQRTLTNQASLVLTVSHVEDPPIQVTISGPAEGSSCISETVIMDAVSKETVNQYNDVLTFSKDRVNNYDVILSDIDGVQLSSIANTKLRAVFQIVDISDAPWITSDTSASGNWVEVLYKKALNWFSNDTDEFPAQGYDNVLVNKCLQLYYEEQDNIEVAGAYMSKARQSLAAIHQDANRGTADVVGLSAHPHDRIYDVYPCNF